MSNQDVEAHSSTEIPIVEGRYSCGDLKRSIRDTFDLDTSRGYWGLFTFHVLVTFVYPLHYYAYVINDQKNCLEIDNVLYGTFYVVALSNFCVLLYIPEVFIKIYKARKSFATVASKIIEHFGFTQIPLGLMTLTIIPDLTTGRKNKVFLTTMNLFLLGYMLLVIGLSITLKKASKSKSGRIVDAKWVKAGFNFFLYLHGGHVFGAIWYSFAIERVVTCWKEAHPHQIAFIKCADYHDLQHQLSCNKTTQAGKSVTEFGIFNAALQSGIVEKKTFLEKYLYCLRWGLQTLSCFGQNLEATTFPAENIFAISVTIYSTVLFVFLIGNMQTYLQSETQSSDRKINFKLRLRLLNEVKDFMNCRDMKVEDLCEYANPVFYAERTRIAREGDPINEMLIVAEGELLTYSSRGNTTPRPDLLKAEDFFGEELVAWAKDENSSSSNLPISSKTVKALTDVKALVLKAKDVKNIFTEYKEKHANSQLVVSSDQIVGRSKTTTS